MILIGNRLIQVVGDEAVSFHLFGGSNGQPLTMQVPISEDPPVLHLPPEGTIPNTGMPVMPPQLAAYIVLGSGVIGLPIEGGIEHIVASQGLNSMLNYFQLIYIPVQVAVTGLRWFQWTQGDYTAAAGNFVAIYTYDNASGNLTRVAISADDGNMWKGASNSWQQKAFPTPVVLPAGIYYAAMCYNYSAQTTNPLLGCAETVANTGMVIMNSAHNALVWGTANVSDIGRCPETVDMNDCLQSGRHPWVCAYGGGGGT